MWHRVLLAAFVLSFSLVAWNSEAITLQERLAYRIMTVTIDIKPGGGFPNSINLGSRGVVPVAVLSTSSFDAMTIAVRTAVFAGAQAIGGKPEDIDGDGRMDMVFHFNTQDLTLDSSSVSAVLTGSTVNGTNIRGEDSVNIVPKNR